MTFAGPRYVADGTFWYDLLEDMEIDVRVQHPQDPSASSNTIRLERSLSSLGAVRFWFRCPLSDRRVAKLYLPPGSGVFGSRPAHGLAYRSQRISRIASNDLHLQVQKGNASEEIMIPFQEIQEIQLKHKDA